MIQLVKTECLPDLGSSFASLRGFTSSESLEFNFA